MIVPNRMVCSLSRSWAVAVLTCSVLLVAETPAADPMPAVKSPLAPEESLKQFVLHPSLQIEIVAAEPEVIDPVAIQFDEHSRR